MKRLARWLVRLYPLRWQERYKDEFLIMLEQYPIQLQDVWDITLGALDARRLYASGSAKMPLLIHVAGWAAWANAALMSLMLLSIKFFNAEMDTPLVHMMLASGFMLFIAPGFWLAIHQSSQPRPKLIGWNGLIVIGVTVALALIWTNLPSSTPEWREATMSNFILVHLPASPGLWLAITSAGGLLGKTLPTDLAWSGIFVGIGLFSNWFVLSDGLYLERTFPWLREILYVSLSIWAGAQLIWLARCGFWLLIGSRKSAEIIIG